MKEKIILVIPILILIIAAVSVFFLFGDKLQQKFFPHKELSQPEKPISCGKDDTACIEPHADNLAKQLTGINVQFALHQCSGIHPCKQPSEKDIQAATETIRAYMKDPSLQIIPINGINPAGIIYYCAKDNRCWKLEAKTNKVISAVKQSISPIPTKHKIQIHP